MLARAGNWSRGLTKILRQTGLRSRVLGMRRSATPPCDHSIHGDLVGDPLAPTGDWVQVTTGVPRSDRMAIMPHQATETQYAARELFGFPPRQLRERAREGELSIPGSRATEAPRQLRERVREGEL